MKRLLSAGPAILWVLLIDAVCVDFCIYRNIPRDLLWTTSPAAFALFCQLLVVMAAAKLRQLKFEKCAAGERSALSSAALIPVVAIAPMVLTTLMFGMAVTTPDGKHLRNPQFQSRVARVVASCWLCVFRN